MAAQLKRKPVMPMHSFNKAACVALVMLLGPLAACDPLLRVEGDVLTYSTWPPVSEGAVLTVHEPWPEPSLTPLADAEISIEVRPEGEPSQQYRVKTDENGRFEWSMIGGAEPITIAVSRPGYRRVVRAWATSSEFYDLRVILVPEAAGS